MARVVKRDLVGSRAVPPLGCLSIKIPPSILYGSRSPLLLTDTDLAEAEHVMVTVPRTPKAAFIERCFFVDGFLD
jgi:hypothetical protein